MALKSHQALQVAEAEQRVAQDFQPMVPVVAVYHWEMALDSCQRQIRIS